MSLQKKVSMVIAILVLITVFIVVAFVSSSQRGAISDSANSASKEISNNIHDLLEVTNVLVSEQVRASMNLLQFKQQGLGEPRLEGSVVINGRQVPNLFIGDVAQANNYQLVDDLSSIVGGTATVFVRSGNDYVRLTTNVKTETGSRAVGTVLDPSGLAKAAIDDGRPFYGQVDILGNPFVTGYEPLKNRNGDVIGILYVGYSADLSSLNRLVRDARVLSEGIVALIDGNGNVRAHSDHVSLEIAERIAASEAIDWTYSRRNFEPWSYQILTAYSNKEVSSMINRQVGMISIEILLGGIVLGVVLLLLANTLTKRVLLIQQGVMSIQRNQDLSQRIEVSGNDEIGQLGGAINSLVEVFDGAFYKVMSASEQLSAAAEELSSISMQTNDSVLRQKLETDQVATAMNEMAASVNDVANNAVSAADSATKADKEANEGYTVVRKSMDAINVLASEVEKAGSVIKQLESDGTAIGKVIDVIQSIAEQTNLLALNAAIEAARAGESGRGFAVVADEVRTLASRTQQSTTEIQEMISRIQNGAQSAVQVMQESEKYAQDSVSHSKAAGGALEGIQVAIQNIKDINTQIASAAEQQSAVADEINQNIVNISQAAEESTTNSEETSKASAELARLASNLQDLARVFKLSH